MQTHHKAYRSHYQSSTTSVVTPLSVPAAIARISVKVLEGTSRKAVFGVYRNIWIFLHIDSVVTKVLFATTSKEYLMR